MGFWLELAATGLITGGIYALVAMGLNLQYGLMRIMNISHGEFLMLGAYLTWLAHTVLGVNPVAFMPAVALALFVAGLGVYHLCFRRVARTSPSVEVIEARSLLIGFGLMYLVQNAAYLAWGADMRGYSFLADPVEIAGARFGGDAADQPVARRGEFGEPPPRGDLGNDVGGGEIAQRGAAGIEHLQHEDMVLRPQHLREGLDEIPAQEARGSVAVRLIDGEHAGAPRLRGAERGGDLVGVVGEVVHHLHAARGADGLEAAADALEGGERPDHVRKRHIEAARRGDGRERVQDIVAAGDRQREGDVLDAEAAAPGMQLDIFAANIGDRAEAEAQSASGERIEIFVLADHQRFAGAGAQHPEHGLDLAHLAMVAMEIEDDADRRRVADQRAVALIGLDDEEVGGAGESVAGKALGLQQAQIAAGVFDAPTLIPGSVAVRGAAGGWSVGRSILMAGASAAATQAATEGFLQATQETRTGAESLVNIGAAASAKAGAGMGAYAASKAGVAKLTEALADECKDRDVTVNAVLPSIIDTAANRADMPKADFAKWVKPEQLAEVIVFLLSPRARAITGATIPVTGRV